MTTLTPAADPGYDAGDAAPLTAHMPPRDRDQLAADNAALRAETARLAGQVLAARRELALANAAVDDLTSRMAARDATHRAVIDAALAPTAGGAPRLMAALAATCEHHTGDDCQVCDDTATIQRLRRLTDPLHDLELMRTNYPTWLARVRAEYEGTETHIRRLEQQLADRGLLIQAEGMLHALHREDRGLRLCVECRDTWPCQSRRILDLLRQTQAVAA